MKRAGDMTTIKRMGAVGAIALALSTGGLSRARADEILTYTGNDFTYLIGAFTPTESVSGTIDLATPLGDSFSGYVTAAAFSFTDGQQTFANTTPNVQPQINFETDAAGAITSWIVSLYVPNDDVINTTNYVIGRNVGDYGYYYNPTLNEGVVETVGVWSVTTSIPEPGPWSVLGVGLLGLITLGRHRHATAGTPRNSCKAPVTSQR